MAFTPIQGSWPRSLLAQEVEAILPLRPLAVTYRPLGFRAKQVSVPGSYPASLAADGVHNWVLGLQRGEIERVRADHM